MVFLLVSRESASVSERTRLFSEDSTEPLILSEHFGLRRRFDFLISGGALVRF